MAAGVGVDKRARAGDGATDDVDLLPSFVSASSPFTDPMDAAQPLPAVRDGERYCRRVLPGVSRTFALSVRLLPGTLGRAVLVAYLICRIADTVEDDVALGGAEKRRLLDLLLDCFETPEAAIRFAAACASVSGDPAHVDLARHAAHVFVVYHALPPGTRTPVRRWASEMVEGMAKFVVRYPRGVRIQTLAEYREYCYYVAGTVGRMLTDLWHEHAPSIGERRYAELRSRAVSFGEALQTVNILKDIAEDARGENAVYVPEQLLRENGGSHLLLLEGGVLPRDDRALERLTQLARDGLTDAVMYVKGIPRRAVAIRLFCILPLLFAYATLRELEHAARLPGGRSGRLVKISRREVRSILAACTVLIFSNDALAWLVDRIRLRPFRVAYGASR